MIKRANLKKKKGFSLIELIIVLAVMAIIALIAIPNFTAVRNNSKLKADIQSCETIKRTVLMLVSDETIVLAKNDTPGIITYSEGGPAVSTTVKSGIDKGETSNATAITALGEALKEVKAPQGTKMVNTEDDTQTPATNINQYKITIATTGDITVETVETKTN